MAAARARPGSRARGKVAAAGRIPSLSLTPARTARRDTTKPDFSVSSCPSPPGWLQLVLLEKLLKGASCRQDAVAELLHDEVRDTLAEFGFTAHIRARGEEAQEIKRRAGYKARRWVVERAHSWLNRFRAILIRWNKKAENYLALLHLAFAIIAYRASGLFG